MNISKLLATTAAFGLMASSCLGADKLFLEGAKHKAIADSGGKTDKRYMIGYFNGYVSGVLDSNALPVPKSLSKEQILSLVATLIQQHPQDHDKSADALIRAAVQEVR